MFSQFPCSFSDSTPLGFVYRASCPCTCGTSVTGYSISKWPSHNGKCNTSRGIFQNEKSLSASQKAFLGRVFSSNSLFGVPHYSMQSTWTYQRNQPCELCSCLPNESSMILKARSNKKNCSDGAQSRSSLLTNDEKVSRNSIVDQRDVLENLLVENEIGTTELSNERLQQSFSESLMSFLIERSGGISNADSDNKHWLSKLKGLVSPRAKGIFLLNILTILYGSNVSIIKQTQTILDPATFSMGRFAIASLAFSPFLWRALKVKQLGTAGFELGVLASIGYLSQCIGLLTTDAGHASFISTFTVIVVPILSGIFGAKIPKITWAAAAVSLLGVGFLESGGEAHMSVGDLWSFISAVFFGIHMLRTEHHSRRLPSDVSMPLLSLQLFVITISCTLWSFYSNANFRAFTLNLQALNSASLSKLMAAIPWIPMLYTGLVSTAFCLWIELVSMRDVSATEAAIIYTLEPIWGAGFAWGLLGERWGSAGWLGALLIIGGSLTVQLYGRVEEPPCMAVTGLESTKNKLSDVLSEEISYKNFETKAQDLLTGKGFEHHIHSRSKRRTKL